MQEIDRLLSGKHVVMDCHDVQIVCAQGFQYRIHFAGNHGYIPRNLGVGIAAKKSRPSVQAHTCINCCAHFAQLKIITANGYLVDSSGLLALVPNNPRDLACIHIAGDMTARRAPS